MSYDLRDFLMFTPEVYLRLFVRMNDTLGLWLLPVVIGLLAVPVLLCLRAIWARRLALVLAAAGWGLTAALFMHRYYASINWPVSYFSWAFAVEALLLLGMALRAPPTVARHWPVLVGGVVVLMLSLLTAWPAASWKAAALPGLAPDTTAVATIILLAGVSRGWRVPLMVVPLLWCLFSTLTHWALGLMLPLVVPAVGAIAAFGLTLWPGPRH